MDIILEKWQEILDTIKIEYEISPISYKIWLKPLTVHSVADNVINVLVPSDKGQVGIDIVNKKYLSPFKVVIEGLTGHEYDIHFLLEEDAVSLNPAAKALSKMNYRKIQV